MPLTLERVIYKKNPDFVARKIAGELVLIPLKRKLEDVGSLYNLNETGCFIWDLIDGKRTTAEILESLQSVYDGETQIFRRDLEVLLEQLSEINAIQTA